LPAGSFGDIVDRRRLILWTEAWMVGVAALLAITTLSGLMTPWLLLALTFAVSAGDAVETPTWRAVLPELVPKEDLPAASALNGIEFNLARATGPALAVAGVGAAFLVNVVSFVGVILVVASWRRPVTVEGRGSRSFHWRTRSCRRWRRIECARVCWRCSCSSRRADSQRAASRGGPSDRGRVWKRR
jgi:MFS family permease